MGRGCGGGHRRPVGDLLAQQTTNAGCRSEANWWAGSLTNPPLPYALHHMPVSAFATRNTINYESVYKVHRWKEEGMQYTQAATLLHCQIHLHIIICVVAMLRTYRASLRLRNTYLRVVYVDDSCERRCNEATANHCTVALRIPLPPGGRS